MTYNYMWTHDKKQKLRELTRHASPIIKKLKKKISEVQL